VGYVIRLEDGLTVYFAGDTNVFGDMRIIGELYQPDLAFLPIGDLFTMGPREAAYACRLLSVKKVIPMHYGTFPVLTGTAEEYLKLMKEVPAAKVLVLKPGETVQ
jgi:L-ascorbate metabolism protein UlaG (beta-lactamase superfamily)